MPITYTYTPSLSTAQDIRAAVGISGIEGSITPPHANSLKSTLYAPRGAVVIRHVTVQEEGLWRAFLRDILF